MLRSPRRVLGYQGWEEGALIVLEVNSPRRYWMGDFYRREKRRGYLDERLNLSCLLEHWDVEGGEVSKVVEVGEVSGCEWGVYMLDIGSVMKRIKVMEVGIEVRMGGLMGRVRKGILEMMDG
jgi:hypothetical protein